MCLLALLQCVLGAMIWIWHFEDIGFRSSHLSLLHPPESWLSCSAVWCGRSPSVRRRKLRLKRSVNNQSFEGANDDEELFIDRKKHWLSSTKARNGGEVLSGGFNKRPECIFFFLQVERHKHFNISGFTFKHRHAPT